MDSNALLGSIDLSTREFSLLLVDPKETFIEWLKAYTSRKGLELWRYYSPEQNIVLVIPSIGRFATPGSFDAFVEGWKPRLLAAELSRFGVSPKEFGMELSSRTFDEFFLIYVRDSVNYISDFN